MGNGKWGRAWHPSPSPSPMLPELNVNGKVIIHHLQYCAAIHHPSISCGLFTVLQMAGRGEQRRRRSQALPHPHAARPGSTYLGPPSSPIQFSPDLCFFLETKSWQGAWGVLVWIIDMGL